jgi:hypothetical protein
MAGPERGPGLCATHLTDAAQIRIPDEERDTELCAATVATTSATWRTMVHCVWASELRMMARSANGIAGVGLGTG